MKPRPDFLQQRQEEAAQRQAISDKLSPEQRIQNLDRVHGEGQGAQRERARLAIRIQANQKKLEK